MYHGTYGTRVRKRVPRKDPGILVPVERCSDWVLDRDTTGGITLARAHPLPPPIIQSSSGQLAGPTRERHYSQRAISQWRSGVLLALAPTHAPDQSTNNKFTTL
jgi:hypothetical protein